jgi:hypothetical protein
VPADYAHNLVFSRAPETTTNVLQPHGFLEGSTYLPLRNAIISAAIDEPEGVIVDLSSLVVSEPSALMALNSARWHISRWPGTPMALVCSDSGPGETIARQGISRRVPMFASIAEAAGALRCRRCCTVRRRTHTKFPRVTSCIHAARELVAAWLREWSRPELISVAKLVVTVFVENVLVHTDSAPVVRLDNAMDVVTVAVGDNSSALATRTERCGSLSTDISGVAIVAALCREWGNAPTPTGKMVWAAIGPENEL